jgi:carbonic anhydrase
MPEYLWIGCSDSRVPANQIVGLAPGDVFVHRNVANVVVHTDLNCLSVLQYAVDVLGVEHVIVCGHYGCGGVAAVLHGSRHGLIDNWLRHVVDVAEKHAAELASLDEERRFDRLCELNVVEQVVNVCQTTIVEDAWARGQTLTVHGVVYGLEDGLLRDLGVSTSRPGGSDGT